MRKLLVLLFWMSVGASCTEEAKDVEPNCVETPYPSDRVCTMIYQPVCGCNGKTYGNACEAEGYGIRQFTVDECGK